MCAVATILLFLFFANSTTKGDEIVAEDMNAEISIPTNHHGWKCQPRPVVKNVGEISEQISVRNVRLYECSGFDGDITTRNHMCVPTETNSVSIKIRTYPDWDTQVTKTFINHTACSMKCVCMKDFELWKCPNKWCPYAACLNDPYEWKTTVEDFWCPRSEPFWDVPSCQCRKLPNGVATRMDEDCGNSVNINILVSAMVGQFLLFVIVQFVFQRYRCLECNGTSDIDKETDV